MESTAEKEKWFDLMSRRGGARTCCNPTCGAVNDLKIVLNVGRNGIVATRKAGGEDEEEEEGEGGSVFWVVVQRKAKKCRYARLEWD